MVNCAIVGCTSILSGKGPEKIAFHRLPSALKVGCAKTLELSNKRRLEWLRAINREDTRKKLKPGQVGYFNPDLARVCGRHFHSGRASKLFDSDSADWIPTLNLCHRVNTPDAVNLRRSRGLAAEKRRQRKERRREAKELESVAAASSFMETQHDLGLDQDDSQTDLTAEMSVQTELTMEDISRLEFTLNDKILHIEDMNSQILKHSTFTHEALKKDPKSVKFYTGLPDFTLLMFVFDLLSPYVKSVNHGSAKFNEFLMFMLRIRLNLPLQDIAFRFGVSAATVSRYFDKWLEASYVRLGIFVRWPTREEIQYSTPLEFREAFGNKIAVIIDCFEVFIERPSSLDARASTWSYYKNHNTAKYLIGITPKGLISFISNGWGGRASDKHITENCGILDKLLPGDIVMADRGFNIAEVLSITNTSLLIPSFTKKLFQLPAMDIEKSRKISNLRIHVERVIGLVRQKYTMLSSKVPIQMLKASKDDVTPLDKIAFVACALCNLNDSIVSKN